MSTSFMAFEIPIPISDCPQLVIRSFNRDKQWRFSEQFYEEGKIVYEYHVSSMAGWKYLDVQFRSIDAKRTMIRATAWDYSTMDVFGLLDKTHKAFKKLVMKEVEIEKQVPSK